jgi:hypothetical protein
MKAAASFCFAKREQFVTSRLVIRDFLDIEVVLCIRWFCFAFVVTLIAFAKHSTLSSYQALSLVRDGYTEA